MLSLTDVCNIYKGFFLANNNNFVSFCIKSGVPHSGVAPNEQMTDYNYSDVGCSTAGRPIARLLVVDDEPDIVQVFKLGLQQSSRFLVDGFTNPEEALQSFKSNRDSYRVVITDTRMPGLSGIELTKRVKEINPNVKVVLMTAFEVIDSKLSPMSSAQIDGFIQKPIGIEELTNKILSIMGESRKKKTE